MQFEFLVAYRQVQEIDIEQIVVETLTKVLEDNLNDVEFDAARDMVRVHHERTGEQHSDENGGVYQYKLVGLTLQLPDEIAQIDTVVEEFAAALPETPPICHVAKFEDPLLRRELAQRAEELFALEMKLRRVLTFIYLSANEFGDPYDLLRDEVVQPMAKGKPTLDQMKAAAENEFFHLTFAQYIGLNQRPKFDVPALLEMVCNQQSYEAFRSEVARKPVPHEGDAELLAGLKAAMNAIEHMRNCVAHNRRPTRGVSDNYINVRPLLEQLLDNYLTRWEQGNDGLEMAEEQAAVTEVAAGTETAHPVGDAAQPAQEVIDVREEETAEDDAIAGARE